MIKGIDVSTWNGNIDWKTVSKEVDFAILRAGYGRYQTQKDNRFEQYYQGCKDNGIKTGVYWYNYAKTVAEAKEEARVCLAVLNGRKLDMPVWYDIEENSVFSTGKDNVSAIAEAFLSIIAAAGYKTGIYSSYNGLNRYFTDSIKNKYDIWIAHVGANGAPLAQTNYSGKKTMWQYSWKGRVNGISGDVDLDYCYVDYSPVVTPEAPKPQTNPVEQKPAETKPTESPIDVYYGSYIGNWLGEIKNCNDNTDTGYSGIDNVPICGFTARATKGTLRYRVHVRGGKWMGWMEKSDRNDWNHGVAGLKGKPIDGVQMELVGVPGYKVQYRVSLSGTKNYLPWVTNYNGTADGYAGVYGCLIDRIQVKIVK